MMLTSGGKGQIIPMNGVEEDSAFILGELIMKGSILCQRCGRSRRERVCPDCGYDSCAIRIFVMTSGRAGGLKNREPLKAD